MKNFPRLTALVGICAALAVALPPVQAVDLMERIVTTQTQFIRHEATEYQRKVAEANARKYMAAHSEAEPKTAGSSKSGKTGGKTAKTDKSEPKEKHAA